MISGQKQLRPCSTGEDAATVDLMVFAHKLNEESATVLPKFCPKINTVGLIESCQQPLSLQKMFLNIGSRAQLIGEDF